MDMQYFFTYETGLPEGTGYSFFDVTHLSWMFVSFAMVGLLVYSYNKTRSGNKRKFMVTVASVLLLCEVVRNVWFIAVGEFTLQQSLPLQLSRILVYTEVLAIFLNSRFLKEFTYACGLFSVAAFIAPDIMQYPIFHIHTLRYSVAHIIIMAVPLMWIFADGFRPDIRYLPKCAALLAGIAVVAETVNILLGSNYLHIHYIPTHVNLNLRQPFFAMAFIGAVIGFWVVIYLPWVVIEKMKKR
ncbi:MAG TPA: TIGR02206 family membrane protein [Clostridia bacterium]|nr:TIGR02206 family membrane protein [Clostridia bacterium]